MNVLARYFASISPFDWQTVAIICTLCAIACYFVKEYLANPAMIIFVYPVLAGLSFLAQYVFLRAELFPLNKTDLWMMWTIAAAICGTIAGIALVAGLARLVEFSRDRRI
jgi:hypothetical protein